MADGGSRGKRTAERGVRRMVDRCYQAAVTQHREPAPVPEDAAGGSQQSAGMAGRECSGRRALRDDWRAFHSPAATCSNETAAGASSQPFLAPTRVAPMAWQIPIRRANHSRRRAHPLSASIHLQKWPVSADDALNAVDRALSAVMADRIRWARSPPETLLVAATSDRISGLTTSSFLAVRNAPLPRRPPTSPYEALQTPS